ncbi:RNA-directed DNA polymerase, eukaryota, reverse transcriptase zinc-binding domain protein, partial [Tanacetum coccineum]
GKVMEPEDARKDLQFNPDDAKNNDHIVSHCNVSKSSVHNVHVFKDSYAKADGNSVSEIDRNLCFVPTCQNECGDEVDIFEEALVAEGCKRWQFTFKTLEGMNYVLNQSPWIVKGKLMIVQQWEPSVNIEKVDHCKIPIWARMINVPLEAWSSRGINTLASRLGKPIMMDFMTASMCHNGVGRIGYARVLVEIDAKKGLPEKNEVVYKDAMKKSCRKKRNEVLQQENMKEKVERVNNEKRNNEEFVEGNNKDKGVVQSKEMSKGINSDSPPSLKKIWRVNAQTVNEIQRSANKYVVLSDEINIEKYEESANHEEKVAVDCACGVSDDEEDIIDDNMNVNEGLIVDGIGGGMSNEIKKNEVVNFIRDGKLQVCALIETHLKQNNINRVGNKVFGQWDWISNIQYSLTSCRIILELKDKKYIARGYPWLILGDFNVTINAEEHSSGISHSTNDMNEFKHAVNMLELEDFF